MRHLAPCAAALGLVVLPPGPASAQTPGSSDYVRGLVAEIRDLTATVTDLQGPSGSLSDEARQIVEGSGNIRVTETDRSVVLSVTSDVLFAFDSAELSPKAKATLTDVAKVLDTQPGARVQVAGHTDAKGSDAYNRQLSTERAAAVVDFLSVSGVERARLQPEGRGEAEPVAPNEIDGRDNPNGRARNRLVEFVLPKG